MRLVVVVLLAWCAVARADEVTGDRPTAERHFRAGEKAYAAQNFEAAATNFELAYQALPLPEIAFAVGQAYRRWYRIDPKLEHAKKSADHYRFYLDKVKTGGKVGVAADGLGDMQREIDKLTAAGEKAVAAAPKNERTRLGVIPIDDTAKRSTGMREIGDMPEDSTKYVVTIDGNPVPAYNLVDVAPGTHKIRVESEGFLPAETTASLLAGEDKSVDVPLKPRPAAIALKVERGARIRVDGRPVPSTFEVPAGKHLVTVSRSGRQTVSREIEVSRGQKLSLEQPLAPTARRRAVPYVVVAGAIGAAISVGALIGAAKYHGDAKGRLEAIQAGDQPTGVLDAYNDAITNRDRALVGFVVTGTAAIGVFGVAAAMYWLDRPGEDEGIRLAPMATAGSTGVTLGGRF